MIVGVGVDRIRIARVEASYARFGSRFVKRIFTTAEFAQATQRSHIARRLAMFFAAKEAVSKALGTGFSQGVAPHMIETRYQSSGKPEVLLSASAAAVASAQGIDTIHLSLSDDDGIALAFAVAEKYCDCQQRI